MRIDDVMALTATLQGVRASEANGLAQWRYHGRLVARQLDAHHIVIRTDVDDRAAIVHQFPETFTVPDRFAKHMMVVADLEGGGDGPIEDALVAAWELQRAAQ